MPGTVVASTAKESPADPEEASSSIPPVTFDQRAREWLRNIASNGLFHKQLPPSRDGRQIPLRIPGLGSGDDTLIDERRGQAYISNAIRTSRYTLYDFFPKQLWFQFTRLSNFYFLCVGIPQAIPGISTTGNITTILPLLFFVLLTILKEGYDDYKRQRLDKVENARLATVLRRISGGHESSSPSSAWRRRSFLPWLNRDARPSAAEPAGDGLEWRLVQWRAVEVGDVLRLSRDDEVPADLILLQADNDDGLAYIETMALDGETNLKTKSVPAAMKELHGLPDLMSCHARFSVEDPNSDLYRFQGRLVVGDETVPLTLDQVLYRGSTLRNTPSAFGLVVNTGEECKIRMNANRHPRAKKPELERITNGIVLSLVAYVFSVAAGCSIGYVLWQRWTERSSWYLEGAGVAWQGIVIGYAIHFNNIIPLSLYVTLEITKIFQQLMLNNDIDMYDEASDTPAKCNTNTILENLGQVGYIFSDKTGTLTENVMKFRKMSIAGVSWLHADEPATLAPDITISRANSARSLHNGRRNFAIPEEIEVLHNPPTSSTLGPEITVSPSVVLSPTSERRQSSSQWRSSGRPDLVQPELTSEDLLEYIRRRPHSAFSKAATDYLLAVALCHTCLPEIKGDAIDFQAASPDELALVRATQELGYLVAERSTQSLTLRIGNDGEQSRQQVYAILDIIEFSSKRKRMSIIVRCPDGHLLLVCKGADSVILPRLKEANLAKQKAREVRKSVEAERQALRLSEAREPRASFGGRPSLDLRRGDSNRLEASSSSHQPKHPMVATRSRSFDIASRARRSGDLMRPSLHLRTSSFEVSRPQHTNSPGAVLLSPMPMAPLPAKFSVLESPAISDDASVYSRCFRHLDDFASEGLRTLLYAQKTLTEAEYAAWKKLYLEATTSLVDREERVESAGEMIEQNLSLVGAAAIEDKLQKGVPETIDKLRRANIKIWMLTGDKRETAINIAHSARICKPYSEIHIIDVEKGEVRTQLLGVVEELREEQLATNCAGAPTNNHNVLVVDGHTLAIIEQSTKLSELFYALASAVDSVICCRASPGQKALLVRAVRRKLIASSSSLLSSAPGAGGQGTALTLAIGDGGNDLAMLAEAHVGVGISGREGLQAARVADYSIAQFRSLARLLLVHGRWNYVRTARFVLATFWKEMYFYTGTIAYQHFAGYTGTSLFEIWSLTALNVLFTSLCTIVPAIWEQDLSASTVVAVPELYVFGQRDMALNLGKYLRWMVGAVAEGLLTFFGCWAGYGVFGLGDQGLFALGNLVFSVAIMWINWKLLIIDTHYKNIMVVAAFLITVASWWAWQALLSAVYDPQPSPYGYAVRDGLTKGFGQELGWWACLAVVLAALVVVEISYKAVKRQLVVGGGLRRRWRRVAKAAVRLGRRVSKVFGLRQKRSEAGETLEDDVRRLEREREVEDDEDLDVELWQELEQDEGVRARLERLCWEDEGVGEDMQGENRGCAGD